MEKGGIFLIRVSYRDLGSLYFSTVKDFQLEEVYDYISKDERIQEALVLWTCNRFEIYFYPGDKETVEFLEDYINERSAKHTVVHGLDAVKHLFVVAAGLDSMVIGENEILAQVKESWEISRHYDFSRTYLNEILRKALEIGRRVRREQGNGRHIKSVASEAIEEAEISSDQKVLLVGAGNLGMQVSSVLSRNGIDFSVSNRSRGRAKEISSVFGVEMEDFDKRKWEKYDVIITATKSSSPLLGRADVRNFKARAILDLGVPPNVSSNLPKRIKLVNMASLSDIIASRREKKNEYATRGLKLVNEEFDKFSRKIMSGEKDEVLRKIFDYSNAVIEEEMKYFQKRSYDPENVTLMRKGLESTRNKLLGFVINGIKSSKDVRSSETVTNMEMILDENLSRYETKKVKKIT